MGRRENPGNETASRPSKAVDRRKKKKRFIGLNEIEKSEKKEGNCRAQRGKERPRG